ncbi:hypothetical protein OCU04_003952 [Sclerotinia nivalis]|uniref:Uncharacterized protein n=1 Tax=Sclerotinia nivalis TaxID=352851 RepID=A0A9X0ASZ4_9HELO|nr:hypothetical protein OCU04_003952 [Sclerotinia nivalis]
MAFGLIPHFTLSICFTRIQHVPGYSFMNNKVICSFNIPLGVHYTHDFETSALHSSPSFPVSASNIRPPLAPIQLCLRVTPSWRSPRVPPPCHIPESPREKVFQVRPDTTAKRTHHPS